MEPTVSSVDVAFAELRMLFQEHHGQLLAALTDEYERVPEMEDAHDATAKAITAMQSEFNLHGHRVASFLADELGVMLAATVKTAKALVCPVPFQLRLRSKVTPRPTPPSSSPPSRCCPAS